MSSQAYSPPLAPEAASRSRNPERHAPSWSDDPLGRVGEAVDEGVPLGGWVRPLAAWAGLAVVVVALIGLWCVPGVVWIEVLRGGPRGALYLTLGIVGGLGALIAIVGRQSQRLIELARRRSVPRIRSG